MTEIIYHLIPESALSGAVGMQDYRPVGFEEEGFIHCTAEPEVSLAVARSYFSGLAERLFILRLDSSALESALKFEEPASRKGAGKEHLRMTDTFPHIYGPLNMNAVVDCGVLEHRGGPGGDGRDEFLWPETFQDPAAFF